MLPKTGLMQDTRTGWPPGLLQDDSRDLSRWLSGRVGAWSLAMEAAERAALCLQVRRNVDASHDANEANGAGGWTGVPDKIGDRGNTAERQTQVQSWATACASQVAEHHLPGGGFRRLADPARTCKHKRLPVCADGDLIRDEGER